MRAKIAKWGNSTGLRIPRSALEDTGFREGDDVDIQTRYGVMEVRKAMPLPTFRLDDLVAEMERLGGRAAAPPLVDWGPDRGAEILPSEDWSDVNRNSAKK